MNLYEAMAGVHRGLLNKVTGGNSVTESHSAAFAAQAKQNGSSLWGGWESRVQRALPWISVSVRNPYSAWLDGKSICPAEIPLEIQHGQRLDECIHSLAPQQGEKL